MLENSIEENKKLIEKFPFLLPRNRFTDKVPKDYDYSYTELDDMPDGWRKAFGIQMCQEIRDDLIQFDYLDKYRIVQIKEKFGGLRWYDNGTPIKYGEAEEFTIPTNEKVWDYNKEGYWTYVDHRDDTLQYCVRKKIVKQSKVPDIISKYENLSYKICINCGKPARWESKGWISPFCDDCVNEYIMERNKEKDDDKIIIIEDCYRPLESNETLTIEELEEIYMENFEV